MKQRYSDEVVAKAVALYKTYTVSEISRLLNVPYYSIYDWCVKGIRNHNVRVYKYHEESIKKQAIQMYKDGFSIMSIANKLNISRHNVYDWCIRRRKLR